MSVIFGRKRTQPVKRNSSFVPGPWHVDTLADSFYIQNKQGYVIAAISGRLSYPKRHAANATVMAAAPDLYECVRGFVEAWGKEVEKDLPMNGGDVVDWVSGAMLEFRVALAKAGGKV